MEQVEGEFQCKHSDDGAGGSEPGSVSVATIQLSGQVHGRRGPVRAAAGKKAPINPLTKQLMDLIFLCLRYNSSNTGSL